MVRKFKPIHPGEILREEFMVPLGLSSNALARAVGVTPARINEIVRERRGITADTALRLARFFNTDVQSWLNLQTHYDIECAQAEAGRVIGLRRHRRIICGAGPSSCRRRTAIGAARCPGSIRV